MGYYNHDIGTGDISEGDDQVIHPQVSQTPKIYTHGGSMEQMRNCSRHFTSVQKYQQEAPSDETPRNRQSFLLLRVLIRSNRQS